MGIGLNWQSWQSWCLHVLQTLLLSPLAEKFLQNQRLSYGQLLFLLLGVENGTRTEPGVPLLQVQLLLEGEGMEITMSSSKSQPQRGKQAVTFRYPSWHFGEPQWGLGLSTWFVWAVPGGSAPLSVPLGDLTVLCPGSSQEPSCPAVPGSGWPCPASHTPSPTGCTRQRREQSLCCQPSASSACSPT